MAFVTAYAELDSLGGERHRLTLHLAPIAYREKGVYLRSDPNWVAGDEQLPHVVTKSTLMASVAPGGTRRLHPTREQDRYLEIGAPYVKVGGVWTRPGFGAATRSANRLTWHNPNADLSVTMGGHFIKMDIELLGGYVPQDRQFAFPVGLNGLTRTGGTLYRDGVPVMVLRKPVLYDAAKPGGESLVIAHQFTNVGGQPYILFTLPAGVSGMVRPVVDPTFEAQPDDATGLDTWINSGNANANYGAEMYISTGNYIAYAGSVRRSLIKFDLSNVPTAAVVSSATLALNLFAADSDTACVVSVYRQKRSWVEAEATWNVYSTGANWETAGGFGAADCEQTPLGSLNYAAAESVGTKTFSLAGASKAALDLGYGWLIRSNVESRDGYSYRSSGHTTEATRPKLTVEYTDSIPFVRAPFWGRW